MGKKGTEIAGQIAFDFDALMSDCVEEDAMPVIEEKEAVEVFCANLGCNSWDCLRHNRNAPWGEICNFKRFEGGEKCKGRKS